MTKQKGVSFYETLCSYVVRWVLRTCTIKW